VQDLERLVARAALGTAGPRDLVGLKLSLAVVPRLRTILAELQAPLVCSLVAELDDLGDLRQTIDSTLVDDPPALTRDGGFARDGVDRELDELRTISRSGKQVIAEMEERERARTGIHSLKVRYNRVFGYYIEISKSNLHAVPPDYHRKQTIVRGGRRLRAERRDAQRHGVPARDPHGTEHGRQVDLPPADGAHLRDGTGRIVRARARGEGSAGGSDLRARRRLRQHCARPLDVHGGDARDGEYPPHRLIPQPRGPRRDRPRPVDVRRVEHCVGGRRVSGDASARAAEDAVRDALPRADRSRRRHARRRELPR